MDRSTCTIDKPLLRHRFGSAAESYDDTAVVQSEVVDRLIALLPPTSSPERVLEIGCGTGLLSSRLVQKFPHATFVFNDIAPQVEPVLRLKVGSDSTFIPADAEQAPWQGSYDLIASSSCIQWWHDPSAFFAKSHSALRPHGELLYSTFLPDTFHELYRVTGTGLHYPSAEQVVATLHALCFSRETHEVRTTTLHFPTFTELLRHIKQTGANALPTRTIWTPRMLKQLEQRFRSENHLTPNAPCPLTYTTIIGIATK